MLTTNRLLARNTLINFLGQILPLAAGLIAVRILIGRLGTDRFGVLTLVWTAIGYFSLFDLGLGRALTQAVATRLGSAERERDLDAVSWTTLLLMGILGGLGGVVTAALTPWLIGHALHIPGTLQGETATAFYILALSLPVTVMTAGFRGVLEAHQDFGVATLLRIPLGIFNFLAPLAVLPFSTQLGPIVALLAIGRFIGFVMHAAVCIHRYPFLRRPVVRRGVVAPLIRLGGWMTVSNIVSPLMVTFDRFMIGAILPIAAIAYYATPFEVVTKLWLIPQAVLGVLFPAFAASFAINEAHTATLLTRAVRLMLILVFPAALGFVVLAREGLTLWISGDFANHSAAILQILAVGVLINCVAQPAFVALQGIGRPDLTGKLHLVELPAYVATIWFLAHAYGLSGVAFAWVLRVTVDGVALFVLTAQRIPRAAGGLAASGAALGVMVAALAASAFLPTTEARIAVLGVSLAAFAIVTWVWLVLPGERAAIRAWIAVGAGGSRGTIQA